MELRMVDDDECGAVGGMSGRVIQKGKKKRKVISTLI
jgi:hypothetical protein